MDLSTPIRQGQTRYQYLVMQFGDEEEISASLNLSEYVELSNQWNLLDLLIYRAELEKLKLDQFYDDKAWRVVSSVFRGLSGKKLIGMGSL